MNKYLRLDFKDAKLYPLKDGRKRLTKDKIFDINGRRDREYEFVEPITVHQISNMLHVLFGQRPKPTHRETVYSRSEYLYNKALDSYLMLDVPTDYKNQYIRETTQTKKAVHNAWSTTTHITWERVKQYTGEHFKSVKNALVESFGDEVLSLSFIKVVMMIRESSDKKLIKFFESLKELKLTALYSFIFDERAGSHLNMSSKTRLTVLSGLDSIVKFSGKIVVPVSDDDLRVIQSNKGCATILDGGLVMIRDVQPDYMVNVDGFTKVSEISLQTNKHEN